MRKSGFTLIELIFVIVIIGLLAAVAVPKFLATKKNAETANMPEIAKQVVAKAEEQYNLIKDDNMTHLFDVATYKNTDLNQTFTNYNKAPFKAEVNGTEFSITYVGVNKDQNNACLKIDKTTTQRRVTADVNMTVTSFTITDLNTTCNQD